MANTKPEGEPLRGRGNGVAGPGGRPAREHGLAPAAGGTETRFQLDCTAGNPGGPRAPVPFHAAMCAASLPARTPAGWAGDDMIDQRSATR